MFMFGGIWVLGSWIRKSLEHFKWGLMVHPCKKTEDNGAGGEFKLWKNGLRGFEEDC